MNQLQSHFPKFEDELIELLEKYPEEDLKNLTYFLYLYLKDIYNI